MARTTTVIQRTNRFTGEKDVVEIENKAASAGGAASGHPEETFEADVVEQARRD